MSFSMALFAQWPLWPGAHPLWNAGALLHLPWCLARGLMALWLITAGALATLWIGGTELHRWAGVAGSPWYAPSALAANPLLWIYVLSLLETMSHSLEPIPPYTNGEGRWMSPQEFRRTGSVWTVLAGVSTPTIFTLASLASNPRTLPMAPPDARPGRSARPPRVHRGRGRRGVALRAAPHPPGAWPRSSWRMTSQSMAVGIILIPSPAFSVCRMTTRIEA